MMQVRFAALGDVLDLSDSGVWGEENTHDGVSVLRSTNFNTDGTLDFSKLTFREIEPKKRESKLLQSGDILLEKSGGGPTQPVGRVCLFRGDARAHSFGNFIARLRVKPSLLPEFLFFFLWHFHSIGLTNQYQKQTTGIRNLEFKRYLAIQVPVPPLPKQRSIIDLLSRAEGIVRLRREASAKAAELIPALFLHLFGDPTTNPNGWPVVPLSDAAQVISGVAKGRKLDPSESVELPYMRVANVKDGYLDLADIKTITIKRDEVDKLLVEPGDLLMTEGGDPDKLGRAALWHGEIDRCVHQNHIFKVRSDRSCVLPEYLRSLVGSPYGKNYFLRVAKKTTGIASINKTQLSAFPVVVAPLALQREFAAKVANLEGIATLQASATTRAQSTFNALLHRAFAT